MGTTEAPAWSPAALAAAEVGSCRRHRRRCWLQGQRAHSASSSAPPDGPAPALAASPAAALSPAGRQYPVTQNTHGKKTIFSKFIENFSTLWRRGCKHAHLSLHFLLFQFNQRQTREIHHACKHTRASRVSLGGGSRSLSYRPVA